MRANHSKTVWISHRGYYKHCVENTLLAFDEAINAGFSMLETDLRCTKDNHLVLCHDPDLSRLGISNKTISDMTYDEIKKVELRFYSKIMFFEEFSDRYAAYNWILDIKPENGTRTIEQLILWAHKSPTNLNAINHHCWFLFWDNKQEALFMEHFPNATILPNQRSCWRAGLSIYFGLSFLGNIQKDKIYALPPQFGGRYFYTKSVRDIFHKKGAKLLAYLPEKTSDIENAEKSNFDFILSNVKPIFKKRSFKHSRNYKKQPPRRKI